MVIVMKQEGDKSYITTNVSKAHSTEQMVQVIKSASLYIITVSYPVTVLIIYSFAFCLCHVG